MSPRNPAAVPEMPQSSPVSKASVVKPVNWLQMPVSVAAAPGPAASSSVFDALTDA
jgi:hypothetical protein